MNKELQDQIKIAVGYTELKPAKCINCKYCTEVDGVIDRTWDYTCNIAGPVGSFTVREDARCSKFTAKAASGGTA